MSKLTEYINDIAHGREFVQNWQTHADKLRSLIEEDKDWSDKYILVCLSSASHNTFLLDHMSQEDFFDWVEHNIGMVGIVNVVELTEEAFEVLEDTYERKKRILRGE